MGIRKLTSKTTRVSGVSAHDNQGLSKRYSSVEIGRQTRTTSYV